MYPFTAAVPLELNFARAGVLTFLDTWLPSERMSKANVLIKIFVKETVLS